MPGGAAAAPLRAAPGGDVVDAKRRGAARQQRVHTIGAGDQPAQARGWSLGGGRRGGRRRRRCGRCGSSHVHHQGGGRARGPNRGRSVGRSQTARRRGGAGQRAGSWCAGSAAGGSGGGGARSALSFGLFLHTSQHKSKKKSWGAIGGKLNGRRPSLQSAKNR